VRSTKPAPGVCTWRIEDTIVVAVTVDGAVRAMDLGGFMILFVVPANGSGPRTPGVDG
jgi:hypothetical protein